MRKIFITLLMLIPLASLANREIITTDEWTNEKDGVVSEPMMNISHADTPFAMNNRQNYEPFFTFGIYHTSDYYKCFGTGLGLMFNLGRTSDFLNVSFGAEYIEYLAGDPRPDEKKNTLGIVDAGSQVVFPIIAKMQLFRTSSWTKFYIGCGCELGLKAHDGGVLKRYYEDDYVIREEKSLAIVPMIGWRSRNVDFGFYGKYYIDKVFNDALPGVKNLGEEDIRIGYHFTWWF